MDKLFKKNFFNDSSRRATQHETPSLQPPAGFYPTSNNNRPSNTAVENSRGQSRKSSLPELDPSLINTKASVPPSKKQPTVEAGQRQQQPRTRQQSLSYSFKQTQHHHQQPSMQQSKSTQYHPSEQQQQQREPRENSNSTLGSNRNSTTSLDLALGEKVPLNQQERPPVPKHQPDLLHPNSNGIKINDSINNTPGKDKVGKKWEILSGQVNTLNEAKTKLEQQIMGLRLEKDQQCMDLERQCEELRRALKFKEDEYTKMQNNFHKHVRAIRATDDDLSTIHAKLTMLQAKTSQLSMTLRGFYQETRSTEIIGYFKKRWPSLKDTLDKLLLHDAATGVLTTSIAGTSPTTTTCQLKLDYPLVCLLVEKMVMEVLMEHVFGSPVHLGLSVNHHYQALSDFMIHHQANDWSNKLRQQLCKIAANANQEKMGITKAKENVVLCLKKEIDIIYQVSSEKLLPKLNKLVDLAAETSLAIHGQDESVLFGTDIVEGHSMYDPRRMNLQFGSTLVTPLSKSPECDTTSQSQQQQSNDGNANDDNDKVLAVVPESPLPVPAMTVRVVVCPVIYACDENGNSSPLLLGRVICF